MDPYSVKGVFGSKDRVFRHLHETTGNQSRGLRIASKVASCFASLLEFLDFELFGMMILVETSELGLLAKTTREVGGQLVQNQLWPLSTFCV